jgi:hypothetical protein
MYVYKYIYASMYVYVWMYGRMDAWMDVCARARVRVCAFASMCVRVCACACVTRCVPQPNRATAADAAEGGAYTARAASPASFAWGGASAAACSLRGPPGFKAPVGVGLAPPIPYNSAAPLTLAGARSSHTLATAAAAAAAAAAASPSAAPPLTLASWRAEQVTPPPHPPPPLPRVAASLLSSAS